MNKDERLQLAQWVVTRAKKAGADEVSVDIGNWREIEIEFRDRKLDQLKESTQNGLNIAIYAGHRYSSHSTNDLRKEKLDKFIEEAVAMTAYLGQDADRSLPDSRYYRGQKELDLKVFDNHYGEVTSDQRVRIAREIEEAAMTHSDRIISCTSGYSDLFAESVKVHSNGFEGHQETTSFSAGAMITLRGEGDKRPQDWAWVTMRYHKELPSPNKLAKECVERTTAQIGQTKLASGTYDMIVENRTAGGLLQTMVGPMSAMNLYRKNSFLEGMLNKRIGSDKLTFIDDPFVPSGLGSQLYDGEGMATRRRVMIEKGILKSYFVDCYYGRKMAMEPTIAGPTNVVFDYGTRSLDDMVKQVKKGILVTSFVGGNSNATTGDFSYGIIGQYIEDGKIIKPVSEMNITGNLQGLWLQLVELGNDPYIYSSWRCPSLYFRDIQFAGL